ncbi:hypothetical protein WUBG_14878 [Wuchereria bancrofti]|uniref:Uncharacterized protein n=1 Tax=Wuchereria bancrofti TaxID=6293 RepID=J9EB15_WUCBA|nr:hypothetical protein WUBG_14878 [Wuchereria bancrofti]
MNNNYARYLAAPSNLTQPTNRAFPMISGKDDFVYKLYNGNFNCNGASSAASRLFEAGSPSHLYEERCGLNDMCQFECLTQFTAFGAHVTTSSLLKPREMQRCS